MDHRTTNLALALDAICRLLARAFAIFFSWSNFHSKRETRDELSRLLQIFQCVRSLTLVASILAFSIEIMPIAETYSGVRSRSDRNGMSNPP